MIENKAKFSKTELISIFGEDAIVNSEADFYVRSVKIDSREVKSGSLFVALKGDKSDGHAFVAKAFASGAKAVMVTKEWYSKNYLNFPEKRFIIVDNTIQALGKLALHHRLRFDIPIIAVAGSNGKTTSKEMISSVLAVKFNVLKTYANYNNQLGVPLMLLSLDSSYNVAVLEIGTNMPGEIALLTDMVLPNYGIITNIGKEHLEQLIDLDGVELEETTLFAKLYRKGTAFINSDDARLLKYTEILPNYTTFGTTNEAEVRGVITLNEVLNPTLDIYYNDREVHCEMKCYGKHSSFNALGAAAIGFAFGLTDSQIAIGLSKYSPKESKGYGRMLVEKVGGIYLINDCYNANPSSMAAAIESLDNIASTGQKIAVFGDMLELGDSSIEEHVAVIKLAQNVANTIILFGKEFEQAFYTMKNTENIRYYSSKDQLFIYLSKIVSGGDCVLVKGSRGTKMEEIISLFKKYY
ncbi:MAG: UDP-N-acetylmuramoyl-tripeptide--D-alanyl-D-alanine ligase [bacterium]